MTMSEAWKSKPEGNLILSLCFVLSVMSLWPKQLMWLTLATKGGTGSPPQGENTANFPGMWCTVGGKGGKVKYHCSLSPQRTSLPWEWDPGSTTLNYVSSTVYSWLVVLEVVTAESWESKTIEIQQSVFIWSQHSYYSSLISSRFYHNLRIISTILFWIKCYKDKSSNKYITKYLHTFICSIGFIIFIMLYRKRYIGTWPMPSALNMFKKKWEISYIYCKMVSDYDQIQSNFSKISWNQWKKK